MIGKTNKGITHFERLQANLSFLSARAADINNQFTQLATHPAVCIEHIFINQMVARATVPLMEEVINCANTIDNDPVCAPLIKYMEKHIAEETDHDQWYVNDLEKLGVSREEIFSRIPPSNVSALVGSQYYLIRHHHPIAFLGYIACLEVNHPTVEYVESLIEKSGLPAEGFSTILEHAVIDSQHGQDIINTINSLPLTEKHFRAIEMSAFQTYRYVALVMEDVCRAAPKNT
ncbi:iron-containing redox enzyme family protein [Pseudocolwellia agarivorans]|mgnify:CR=1 FL=1|uniref:iron-containing redox enzyme family protein n=1 Tax=Pseudocolwellia agarivorans TaxID=1911682 RepID=UPI000984DCD6|nr:iron-containing redox enzyme family protein [Pseudocolwellia agarivorans]